MPERLPRWCPPVLLAGLCYVPLLLTSPGQVVADTKSYLYLDPGRLLSRASSMWDPHVGLGTVTHQNIGFLWPMGPYFWVMEHLGFPDWVAERLWLGSIMFVAGLGVWYLLRTWGWRGPAVSVAVVAYAFTPYLLTIAVRISAILLPYVALPWMIALAARGARSRSWRHPALFALIVATVGTSNATAIILAGVGPVLWLLWAAVARDVPLRAVLTTVGKIAVLTLATNAWWIAGLSVQASNGIDVLDYTESVEVTATASSAQEVLRGLGYWFFYGDDAVGPWIGPSGQYQTSALLLLITFAIPAAALLAGGIIRWRHRGFFVGLAAAGLLLAVGVYPYDDPPPFGRVLRTLLLSDVGKAMRSMPRAAPLVVLASAVLLGAGVLAISRRRPGVTTAVAGLTILVLLAALAPLWRLQLAPENLSRPEEVPGYWVEATDYLEEADDGTRVLEVPGSDFTSYRWGTTIDPVTPGLMDRPMAARELVPMGSAPSANLLKAFDGRLQNHLTEPASVAPIARLLRAGHVLVRSDLAFEHYDTPRPRELWSYLAAASGLEEPVPFGPTSPNVAVSPNPMLDELELDLDPALEDPPALAAIGVTDALPIAAVKPADAPVVVAGDGDGLVDAAAAGLLDGNELVRYSAEMSDDELADALDRGAVMVLTDTNRRRGERWGTIRHTTGYTEPAGLDPLADDPTDARLPVFTSGDDARTVAVHDGGVHANATSYGARNLFYPHRRPANAVDGDPSTSWRTGMDDPVLGERIELRFDEPVTTSTLTFLAPQDFINRWVTRVALRFDGGDELEVDLDERSRTEPGQTIDVGERTFDHLSVEIIEDSVGRRPRYGGLTSTGFAEIGVADRRLDEVIRPPVDLLSRAGGAASDHPLAVVLTRLRSAPTDVDVDDEERSMARRIALPDDRAFRLEGTAHVSSRADDAVLSALLDGTSSVVATSSSRLPGHHHRASAALDGDPRTAWATTFDPPPGEWLEIRRAEPAPLDHLELDVVADGRHSVPTRIALEADGAPAGTFDLEPIGDATTPGATTRVALDLPEPTRARTLRIVVEDLREVTTPRWRSHVDTRTPVAIAEVGWEGARVPPRPGALADACRDDLLTLNGEPVPLRIDGDRGAAATGGPLAVATCDGRPLELRAGDNDLRTAEGRAAGIDLDRLVLRSGSGGDASTATGPLRDEVDPPATAAITEVVQAADDSARVRVTGAQPGEPLWLSFGQSHNLGWEASIDGDDLGPPALVDGFANGWIVDAPSAEFEVQLTFTPQQRVDVALWLSAAAALLCLVLAILRPARSPIDQAEPLAVSMGSVEGPPLPRLGWGWTIAVAIALGAVGALVVSPLVAVLTALLAVVEGRALLPRVVTACIPALAMAAAGAYVTLWVLRYDIRQGLEWPSELTKAHPVAWFAVLALVVDVVVHATRRRVRR